MDLHTLRGLAQDYPPGPVNRTVSATVPAVATDWTLPAPGESVWWVTSITATLVTDANVANRHPDLTLTDGVTPLWRVPLGAVITAGLTTIITWLPGLGYAAPAIVGNRLAVGIPDLVLQPGWTIGTTGSALQAADQWSAITVEVVEVFSGERENLRTLATNIVERAEAIAELIEGNI